MVIVRKQPLNWHLKNPLLAVLCMTLTLKACDCIRDGNGVVIDSSTNQPLDSVTAKSYVHKVKKGFYESEMLTDTTGDFFGSTGLRGGGMNSCPDLIIELSRVGFTTEQITNPNDDTVFMTRE